MHLGKNYCRRHLQQQRSAETPYGPSREDAPPIQGWVYFIGSIVDGKLGPIKIGFSMRLDVRIGELQNVSAYPLTLLATWRCVDMKFVEQRLHRKFKAHRMRGEWFQPAPELLELIELIAAGKLAEAGQRIV